MIVIRSKYGDLRPVSLISWILTIILIVVSGCSPSDGKTQRKEERQTKRESRINIHGANALYPLVQVWSEAYCSQHPTAVINVIPASSNKGKVDVMLGLADIGMYSDLPDDEILKQLNSFAVVKDAILITFNPDHPEAHKILRQGISRDLLREIYISGNIEYWDQLPGLKTKKRILAFTRSDFSGASGAFAEFLGSQKEKLIGIGVYGDSGMSEAIRNEIYSMGYDNHRYVFDSHSGAIFSGMAIIPVDLNGDGMVSENENFYSNLSDFNEAVSLKLYPYPLSRNLYFLLKPDQDNPIVLDFIRWVYTEGQTMIRDAGYVPFGMAELRYQEQIFLDKYGE